MAQFDVHRNTGKHRDAIPFVVIVQSSVFSDYRRRVVVPLVRKSALGPINHVGLNPSFRIEEIDLVLHPLEIVSIPNEQLGEYILSLSSEGARIITALDELLSRAWK